jgi:hypothetical protein
VVSTLSLNCIHGTNERNCESVEERRGTVGVESVPALVLSKGYGVLLPDGYDALKVRDGEPRADVHCESVVDGYETDQTSWLQDKPASLEEHLYEILLDALRVHVQGVAGRH